ncbi:transglycosylase family protein [Pseudonocardia sp. NPDC046786]|uniref:transglycosylase family protein n=1 Tax=Pseudonocardia sp. NPDC046786 TaxID=3155471 RepID=UPI0033DA55FB
MDTWWEQHRPASVLGTVLLVVGALAGAQVAVGAVFDPVQADERIRAALSPYRDGAFTVRAASVDHRVDIATAEDGSYVLGHTPAGSDVVLDLDLLEGDAARPWWVEPDTGRTMELETLESAGVARFPVPEGGGVAWVLVVDDAAAGYPMPDVDAIAEFVGQVVRAGTARGAGPGSDGGGDGAAAEDAPPGSRSEHDGTHRDAEAGEGEADRSTGDGRADGSAGPGSAQGRNAEGHAPRAGDAPASGSDPDAREFRTGGPAPGEQRDEQPDRPAAGSGSADQERPDSVEPQEPQETQQSQGPKEPQQQEAPDLTWDRLAQCESSGDWSISTGNGYYGGLQFDRPTWTEFGGTAHAPTADGATREQQIEIATKVRDARGGYGSWPACARKLGLPR